MDSAGVPSLTSTTAPGKFFSSRSELADHYKSDWHKYNLKRREAGLPLLAEADFIARWEAAMALRKEKELDQKRAGAGHLKKGKSKKGPRDEDGNDKPKPDDKRKEEIAASQENPDIDPNQSLFDSHVSSSLDENIQYMQKNFGFFLPDREHVADLEGLLGYCHEKIKLGHYCLYCEKLFPTWQGCQKHMVSKSHTKLRYEPGHWDEFDIFYDFSDDNEKFVQRQGSSATPGETDEMVVEEDDGSEEWEDMSDAGSDAGEDEMMQGYEQEIAKLGLDVTPLGELVFPDGRIVGHRALRRYYKQRPQPVPSNNAVIAAQRAAGDRLYQGKLINIGPEPSARLASQQKGIGKGILVKSGDGGGFSALSMYRYRAVVRKQRREDDMGRRAKYRTAMNTNKMDKKANRIMNGVSVAHAKR